MNTTEATHHQLSEMAENLKGSEIIKLAGEIREKIEAGETIYNFTIGDFDPKLFSIPIQLKQGIIRAYETNETNYPAANGIAPLRQSVSTFIKKNQGLEYDANSFLIAGGARPLIYAAFQAIVNNGEKVLFPVPSWNNNHYTHLAHGEKVMVETRAENNFMPTAEEIIPHLSEVGLLALCSPLNPTGTVFTAEDLEPICHAILDENKKRQAKGEKPLYLMYDQIYWTLTHGKTKHVDPVTLVPEMREYTLYIDGMSKAFAATGVRVGWAFGPQKIINAMKSILGHIGAWAPKAEQVAASKFVGNMAAVKVYLDGFKEQLGIRLDGFYKGFQDLAQKGYAVDAIAPQAAIYLTVKFDLVGKKYKDIVLSDMHDVTAFLLNEAGLAVVPFYAFGASVASPWFRLSVGTSKMDDITQCFKKLENVLSQLH